MEVTLKGGDRLVVTTPTGTVSLTAYSTMTGVHLRPVDSDASIPVSFSMFSNEVRTMDEAGEVIAIDPDFKVRREIEYLKVI